ncbi:MAG: hypothetical protein AB1634_00340 [Thermodesulfobacteriota bacterium]
METLTVVLIGMLAFFFAGRWLWRVVRGRERGCACSQGACEQRPSGCCPSRQDRSG